MKNLLPCEIYIQLAGLLVSSAQNVTIYRRTDTTLNGMHKWNAARCSGQAIHFSAGSCSAIVATLFKSNKCILKGRM